MTRWLHLVALCVMLAACGARPSPATAPVTRGPGHLFRPTSGPVISSPLVADLDGDGSLEIAFGCWDGYFYVTDPSLNDRYGWPRYSVGGYFSSPAAADLDGDGRLEILVGSESGRLYGWRENGAVLPGWPVSLRHRLWASPTILEGGRVAILGSGQFFVLDARGRPVRGWPRPALGWGDSTAATGGGLVAVATLAEGIPDEGAVHLWAEDGTPVEGYPVRLSQDSDSSPALADLDGDGVLDVIVGDDSGLVHALDRAGNGLPGWPTQTGSLVEASPAIADLDGDGWLDVVVGSWDGRVYAWDRTGKPLPGWPVRAGDQFISSAALVDLTGDGLADVVAGSKDHMLYAWDGAGRTLSGFPRDLGDYVFSSPWVGDLNRDGLADIVVGANNGIHLLSGVAPLGTAFWPRFHADDQLRGHVPAGGQ